MKKQQDTAIRGNGGELHQQAEQILTTNHGVPLSDNQYSLRHGDRGPTLLEDFALREKVFAAVQFVMDAYSHLKAIGHTAGAAALLDKAGVVADDGVMELGPGFIEAAACRFYDREPKVRTLA